MNKATVMAELRRRQADLRVRGVGALYLFGSHARGEETDESDIDLFFEPTGRSLSLLDVIAIRHFLEDELHRSVDVMTRSSIHPVLKDCVEVEAELVF